MRASVTSSVRPSPSESTTESVSPPGRWMLRRASRNSAERTVGARRASAMMPMATAVSTAKIAEIEATKTTATKRS